MRRLLIAATPLAIAVCRRSAGFRHATVAKWLARAEENGRGNVAGRTGICHSPRPSTAEGGPQWRQGSQRSHGPAQSDRDSSGIAHDSAEDCARQTLWRQQVCAIGDIAAVGTSPQAVDASQLTG
jgi:hypothetical protein